MKIPPILSIKGGVIVETATKTGFRGGHTRLDKLLRAHDFFIVYIFRYGHLETFFEDIKNPRRADEKGICKVVYANRFVYVFVYILQNLR